MSLAYDIHQFINAVEMFVCLGTQILWISINVSEKLWNLAFDCAWFSAQCLEVHLHVLHTVASITRLQQNDVPLHAGEGMDA